jgi:hypothetical protein
VALEDLAPLSGLTALEMLTLGFQEIEDYAFLEELEALWWYLAVETGMDNAAVGYLSGKELLLCGLVGQASVDDLSPLADMDNLVAVALDGTGIADLSLFEDKTDLEGIQFAYTQVEDLQPLVDNPGIGGEDWIGALGCPLTNEAACEQIPAIQSRLYGDGTVVHDAVCYRYLTLCVEGDGDTDPAPDVYEIEQGETFGVSATANAGSLFFRFEGDYEGDDPYYPVGIIPMDRDRFLRARFVDDPRDGAAEPTLHVVYYTSECDVVPVEITVDFEGPAQLMACGLEVRLRDGWRYHDTENVAGVPDFQPEANATGTLEFGWQGIPELPVTFTVYLRQPESHSFGHYLFEFQGIYRTKGEARRGEEHVVLFWPVVVEEGEWPCGGTVELTTTVALDYRLTSEPVSSDTISFTNLRRHSADQNGDFRISLGELLRVIQLFNSGGYHCDEEGEDGYAPGPGDQTCEPHSADYGINQWSIVLSELLRVIQIFNSGNYFPSANGEDGFILTAQILHLDGTDIVEGCGGPTASPDSYNNYDARKYYGAPLEPLDRIFMAAGQEPWTTLNFQNYVHAMTTPCACPEGSEGDCVNMPEGEMDFPPAMITIWGGIPARDVRMNPRDMSLWANTWNARCRTAAQPDPGNPHINYDYIPHIALNFDGNLALDSNCGTNDKQTLTILATDDYYGSGLVLEFDGMQTNAIDFDQFKAAPAEKVQEALEALSRIGANNVNVSCEACDVETGYYQLKIEFVNAWAKRKASPITVVTPLLVGNSPWHRIQSVGPYGRHSKQRIDIAATSGSFKLEVNAFYLRSAPQTKKACGGNGVEPVETVAIDYESESLAADIKAALEQVLNCKSATGECARTFSEALLAEQWVNLSVTVNPFTHETYEHVTGKTMEIEVSDGLHPDLLLPLRLLSGTLNGPFGRATTSNQYTRQPIMPPLDVPLGLSNAELAELNISLKPLFDEMYESLNVFPQPLALRLASECNGRARHLCPDRYKRAFRRIVDELRARGLRFASIWHVLPGEFVYDWTEYWPGDAYVDWIGVSVFTTPPDLTWETTRYCSKPYAPVDIRAHDLLRVLEFAEARNKPVMIAESTPVPLGVAGCPDDPNTGEIIASGCETTPQNFPEPNNDTTPETWRLDTYCGRANVSAGEAGWDWFQKIFSLIRRKPGIKIFNYLNEAWMFDSQNSENGLFKKDARLPINDYTRCRFGAEMAKEVYLHANRLQEEDHGTFHPRHACVPHAVQYEHKDLLRFLPNGDMVLIPNLPVLGRAAIVGAAAPDYGKLYQNRSDAPSSVVPAWVVLDHGGASPRVVALLDGATGNLYLAGSLVEDSTALAPDAEQDEFLYQDSDDLVLARLTPEGDLHLRGSAMLASALGNPRCPTGCAPPLCDPERSITHRPFPKSYDCGSSGPFDITAGEAAACGECISVLPWAGKCAFPPSTKAAAAPVYSVAYAGQTVLAVLDDGVIVVPLGNIYTGDEAPPEADDEVAVSMACDMEDARLLIVNGPPMEAHLYLAGRVIYRWHPVGSFEGCLALGPVLDGETEVIFDDEGNLWTPRGAVDREGWYPWVAGMPESSPVPEPEV